MLPLVDLLLPDEEELSERLKEAMAKKNLAIAKDLRRAQAYYASR